MLLEYKDNDKNKAADYYQICWIPPADGHELYRRDLDLIQIYMSESPPAGDWCSLRRKRMREISLLTGELGVSPNSS
jgi:hypothetical protein